MAKGLKPSVRTRTPTDATNREHGAGRHTPAGTETAQPAGRTAINVYISPEAHRQLRILALDEKRSGQHLIVEAVNLLFAKYGLPQIAD